MIQEEWSNIFTPTTEYFRRNSILKLHILSFLGIIKLYNATFYRRSFAYMFS